MATAKTPVSLLMDICERAVAEDWQYVYGAKGDVLSAADIRRLRGIYGNKIWASDLSKAGRFCCDCSGLISYATDVQRGSSQYKETALQVVPISKRTPAMRGWAVWMPGHIGVYDGAGGYYAMDGSGRNAVHYPLSRNKFTHILELCDIDYSKQETKNERRGDTEMRCLYQVDGKPTVYYYDGQTICSLSHPDQVEIIKKIYRDNNDKEIPYYHWNSKEASWHGRLAEVCKRMKDQTKK